MAIQALAQMTGRADWRIDKDPDGRPFVLADGERGPDLSLSHSGSIVAAALTATGRIGIDVEQGGRRRDYLAIAQEYLSQAEIAAVTEGGEDVFLALWTMREALAKAMGGGLPAALSLDGEVLVGAMGRSGTLQLQGEAWALVQERVGSANVALAWSQGDSAALEAALKRATSAIEA